MMYIASTILVAATLGLADTEVLLTGSRMKFDEAIRRSQLIAVAKGDKCVDREMGAPVSGGSSYTLRIEPTRYLKGLHTSEILKINYLKCSAFLDRTYESLPIPENEYVFFIERVGAAQTNCIKVAPASPKMLSEIAAELRKEERLPGFDLSPTMGVVRADCVAIGTVLTLGPLKVRDSTVEYPSLEIEVSQNLMGETPGRITVGLLRKTSPEELAQKEPTIGKSYIFFIETQKDRGLRCFKILPMSRVFSSAVQLDIQNKLQRPAG